MMTEEEMRKLEQASGAEFDRMFLEMMIRHHQGAIDMAKTEVAKGANPEAKALAQRIIDAQQIHGLICFFNERADLFVDGEPQEHPVTPWS